MAGEVGEAEASILWRESDRAPDASVAMNITAAYLLHFGAIHYIVYEPAGGAYRDRRKAITRESTARRSELERLIRQSRDELRTDDRTFFKQMRLL